MANHTIISAGSFTATLTHPLVNGGVPTTIEGFKFEGQMVQADPSMDSSKIVQLANGNTVTITNNCDSGTLTVGVTKTESEGDLVKISKMLRKIGDSVGGTFRFTQEINGVTSSDTFYGCTVKTCKLLSIQGNDVPDYQVVWNFAESDPGNGE